MSQTFQQVYEAGGELVARDKRIRPEMDEFLDRKLQRLWEMSKQPRKLASRSQAIMLPGGRAVFDHVKGIAKRWTTAYYRALDKRRAELALLAQATLIPVDETGVIYLRASGADFHSQGFGCNKYAKGSAVTALMRLQSMGVKAILLEQENKAGLGKSWMNYYVLAYTNELGAEVCRHRKEGASEKEVAKTLLKMGVNPRVYNPFLSHGWEQEMGLDSFGNDLTLPQATVATA